MNALLTCLWNVAVLSSNILYMFLACKIQYFNNLLTFTKTCVQALQTIFGHAQVYITMDTLQLDFYTLNTHVLAGVIQPINKNCLFLKFVLIYHRLFYGAPEVALAKLHFPQVFGGGVFAPSRESNVIVLICKLTFLSYIPHITVSCISPNKNRKSMVTDGSISNGLIYSTSAQSFLSPFCTTYIRILEIFCCSPSSAAGETNNWPV